MRHIHKFGGSSLANAACYQQVATLVRQYCQDGDLVVVSAAGDTTDALLALTPATLPVLLQQQQQLLTLLPDVDQAAALAAALAADADTISQALARGIDNRDWLLAFGELWSARLLAALLGACCLDARQFLVIADGCPVDESAGRLQALLDERLTVVTGFIGADAQGQTRTLGRNGSDYTATLLARYVDAATVTIWTDVAGIYTADPRQLSGAYALRQLSGNVATELARLGSPVLHPRTLAPLDLSRQSLRVRSTFSPEQNGTCIAARHGSQPLASLTWRQPVYRCYLPQATPEQRQQAYATENGGQILYLPEPAGAKPEQVALLALVGNDLSWQSPAGQALAATAATGTLLQQSSGEGGLSLLALVRQLPSAAALAQLHDRLFAVGVVVLGLGTIGRRWLDGFAPQLNSRLRLYGLLNSRQQLFDGNGIDPAHWQDSFARAAAPRRANDLLLACQQAPFAHLMILDLTASAEVASQYPALLAAGAHLVSANKQAGAAPQQQYDRLQLSLQQSGRHWRYNTTVGAGLPVQAAIADLLGCGDQLEQLSGVFSGTLCWLFQHFDGTRPFSALVREAHAKGFTEPDPRDDLNGQDAARKLLILAREAGWRLELGQISIDNLVPAALQGLDREASLARLEALDGPLQQALQAAQADGKVLRYVAQLRRQGPHLDARVGLQALAADHPFANLTPGDNIFAIQSHFYQDNPLIIRGPGAGPQVTAAGIQSDVLQLLNTLA
ncbi:bifunctional aspartate kinase/homoserine dehydrogenase II [Gallaecimonas sp. GXIMD1310]|uniref:amino acid kinase family protein n=1 Tax=Gallaecimonas sp. GXIMD1310 TaxID=3131926 RepID=UPI00324E3E95